MLFLMVPYLVALLQMEKDSSHYAIAYRYGSAYHLTDGFSDIKIDQADMVTVLSETGEPGIVKINSTRYIIIARKDSGVLSSDLNQRLTLGNFDQIKNGCLNNMMYSINLLDKAEVKIGDFKFTIKVAQQSQIRKRSIRTKRSLMCYGAGAGVAVGEFVSVVGVAVVTTCDTSGLEARVTKEYHKRFEQLRNNVTRMELGIQDTIDATQNTMKEVDNMIDDNKRNMASLTADQHNLNVAYNSLKKWFSSENNIISRSLNLLSDKTNAHIGLILFDVLDEKIWSQVSNLFTHWSLNSLHQVCERYYSYPSGRFFNRKEAVFQRKVNIDNIKVQGSLTVLQSHQLKLTEIMKKVVSVQNKTIISEKGLLKVGNSTIQMTSDTFKSLSTLTEGAINHLKFTSKTTWIKTIYLGLSLSYAFLVQLFAMTHYKRLMREHGNHSLARRQPEFWTFLVSQFTVIYVLAKSALEYLV